MEGVAVAWSNAVGRNAPRVGHGINLKFLSTTPTILVSSSCGERSKRLPLIRPEELYIRASYVSPYTYTAMLCMLYRHLGARLRCASQVGMVQGRAWDRINSTRRDRRRAAEVSDITRAQERN